MTDTLKKFGDYMMPLMIASKVEANRYDLDRFAGCAFNLTADGSIATCSHIARQVGSDEILVAQDTNDDKLYPVSEISYHKNLDFAVGHIERPQCLLPQPFAGQVLPGLDVFAMGHSSAGKEDKTIKTERRYFKGYVTQTTDQSVVVELSFPSLPGFSGAPVWVWGNGEFAGMLFGNHESTIEIHSFEERREDDSTATERIYRVIEFGLMIPVSSVTDCCREMGVTAFN